MSIVATSQGSSFRTHDSPSDQVEEGRLLGRRMSKVGSTPRLSATTSSTLQDTAKIFSTATNANTSRLGTRPRSKKWDTLPTTIPSTAVRGDTLPTLSPSAAVRGDTLPTTIPRGIVGKYPKARSYSERSRQALDQAAKFFAIHDAYARDFRSPALATAAADFRAMLESSTVPQPMDEERLRYLILMMCRPSFLQKIVSAVCKAFGKCSVSSLDSKEADRLRQKINEVSLSRAIRKLEKSRRLKEFQNLNKRMAQETSREELIKLMMQRDHLLESIFKNRPALRQEVTLIALMGEGIEVGQPFSNWSWITPHPPIQFDKRLADNVLLEAAIPLP